MKCLSCEHDNAADVAYCVRCGNRLNTPCPACGSINAPGQNYCGSCGNALTAPAAPSIVRPYTPAALSEGELSSRFAQEGEHKQVTILFCDIVDSTVFAERLGAEAWHQVLNQFFEHALAEIHGHGGTLNQFLGDGFMAIFGAPLAYEDHAERAAHVALKLIDGDESYRNIGGDTPLQLRIGLNTGDVVVGKIGDNLRMDYTAIGDTTNLAARMQSNALPGEIRLTNATWRGIAQHFNCESLGEQRIKGKSALVQIYRLVDLHADLRAHHPSYSNLVGRDRERELMEARLARLRRGEGGVTGVLGDAGLGKSRLLLEVAQANGEHFLWLQGRAFSFGQSLSFGPFIEALRGAANMRQTDRSEECWRALETFVTRLLGNDSAHYVPFAGMLMGLELPRIARGLFDSLDATDVRAQIYITARKLFEAMAATQPLVVEFDDWHWADASSADLLEHLLPLIEAHRLHFFVAGRVERDTPLSRLRNHARTQYADCYTEILLSPLSSSESNELIDDLLATKSASAHLRSLVLDKADGNPLFVEEIVHTLQASGTLNRDNASGVLHLEGNIDPLALPDTIEGIVAARIDRLEEDVRHVLKLAAVVGRNFHRRILVALDEAEQQLDNSLHELEDLELIREKNHAPEIEYMFKHSVVQEASYKSILGDRRRELHEQVAKAMEHLFSDRLDEYASFLAYHYARGEVWSKAQEFMLRAGDQAARMAADAEAAAHYENTLDILSRATDPTWSRQDQASLECKLGEALFRLGKRGDAIDYLYRSLHLLGVDFPRGRWTVRGQLVLHIVRRLWFYARGRHRRSTKDAAASRDHTLVHTVESLAWIDYFANQERFLLDVLVGLELVEQNGPSPAVVEGYMGLGVACDVLGYRKLAAFHHGHAKTMAEAIGDDHASANSALGLAMHADYAGRWKEMVERMALAACLFEKIGRLHEWGICLLTLTSARQLRGEFALAQSHIDPVIEAADDAGDRHLQNAVRYFDGVQKMMRGQLEAAHRAMRDSVANAENVMDTHGGVEFRSGLALCALWRGDIDDALRAIEEGDATCRQYAVPADMESRLRFAEASIALAQIDANPTGPAALAARTRLKRSTARLSRLAKVHAGAEPLALSMQANYHFLAGKADKARALWSAAISAADAVDSPYMRAISLFSQGEYLQNATAVCDAAEIFEASGAAIDLARAYRVLVRIYGTLDRAQAEKFADRANQLHKTLDAEFENDLLRKELKASVPYLTTPSDPR